MDKIKEMSYAEKRIIIADKVGSGLRNMQNPPDGLIYIIEALDDFVLEDDSICGLTVMFTSGISNPYGSNLIEPCPFVPVWNYSNVDYWEGLQDIKRFSQAYDDFS